jgi:hypothetical protein
LGGIAGGIKRASGAVKDTVGKGAGKAMDGAQWIGSQVKKNRRNIAKGGAMVATSVGVGFCVASIGCAIAVGAAGGIAVYAADHVGKKGRNGITKLGFAKAVPAGGASAGAPVGVVKLGQKHFPKNFGKAPKHSGQWWNG